MSAEENTADEAWPELDDLKARACAEDWHIDIENECKLDKALGKGSSGEAYLARWRGAEVVVKKVTLLSASTSLARKAFIRECEIMARLRHPNLLPFYGVSLDAAHIALVCQYAEGGTLKHWLHSGKVRRSLGTRLQVVLDIARGMTYLAARTPAVMHRDLKPSNVFMTMDDRALVADFGLARFIAAAGEELTGETGTYIYMAPEVIKSQRYDTRADVYSFGVLMYEIVTGIEPFQPHNSTGIQIATAVADRAFRPKIPETTHAGIAAIIEMCWQQSQDDRPPFEQVLSSLEHMIPDILKEEESRRAKEAQNPTLQSKALQNLSQTFQKWSDRMSELAN